MRRAFFWVMIASIVVLPLWLLFGRALFGAPLGTAMLPQVLLGILLAMLIAGVAGTTIARKEVRGPRSATWHDVRLVGPWLLAIAVLALLVVDEDGDGPGSALTAVVGDGALTASASLSALLTLAIVVGGVVVIVTQITLLLRETRARVTSYLAGVGVQSQGPIVRGATFERVDDPRIAPQAGETITLDGPDGEPSR